jgi:perosamine synthetase
MTGYQAAFGVAQLERIEETISRKRAVASMYSEALASVRGLRLPTEQGWARHVYWMYGIVVEPEFGISRDVLASQLSAAGIETRTFFCPMNLQPCLQKIDGFRAVPCPVAESLWDTGLYLPSSPRLAPEAVEIIARAIHDAQSVPAGA